MKEGDIFYANKGPGGQPYKCHVLAVIDEVMIVYKWYGRSKKWWHYQIEHVDIVMIQNEMAAG